jgi:integrase
MPSIGFTAKKLESMEPESIRKDYWDKSLKGFVLRISPDGSKVFSVYYRIGGKQRRKTIGPYPLLSLADAREIARADLELVRQGIDPTEEQKRREAAEVALRAAGFKFRSMAAQYIEEYAKINKKSWGEDQRLLDRLLLPEFGDRNAKDITRSEIRTFLRTLAAKTPVQANRTLACIRKIFSWAIKEEVVELEANPATNISAPGGRYKPKERALEDSEIKRLWIDLEKDSNPVKRALQLILLTGQRPGEVVGMRWSEINLAECIWTIPGGRTKNGEANIVPLSSAALRILEKQKTSSEVQSEKREKRGKCAISDEFVFPCKVVARPAAMTIYALDQAAQILSASLDLSSFTPHDLRRTCATRLRAMLVPGHVIARILNHKQKDITSAVYNKYQYLNEKREALEQWSVKLSRIASPLTLISENNSGATS